MSGRGAAAAVLAAGVLALPLAGCGDDGGDATVRVLAAASLTDVLTDLAATFEEEHEGVEVALSFGSSTDLAGQAADGAPGDVLATADEPSMTIAREAGVAPDPTLFASNHLVIATPPGNPAEVTGLGDLGGATWVRCADEVPCGRAALALLGAEGVTAEPVSLEEDARATLDKVVSGEADAALVYATDAVAAGEAVETVRIPGADDDPASYYVATLDQAADPGLAQDFVDLLLGDDGRAALADAGFGAP